MYLSRIHTVVDALSYPRYTPVAPSIQAALCLLRTGDHDEEAGKMFELYARLRFTERLAGKKSQVEVLAPANHEKEYVGTNLFYGIVSSTLF